jgi:hypothetical protein
MPARAYYSVPASGSGGKPEGRVGLIIVAPQFACQLAPSGPGADLSSSHLIIFPSNAYSAVKRYCGGRADAIPIR